jgi:hypothetical protein
VYVHRADLVFCVSKVLIKLHVNGISDSSAKQVVKGSDSRIC